MILNDNKQTQNPEDELFCDVCGMTYKEFLETGVYRCENCYRVFKAKTVEIIKKKIEEDKKITEEEISQSSIAIDNRRPTIKKKIEELEKLLELCIKLDEKDKIKIIEEEIKKLKEQEKEI